MSWDYFRQKLNNWRYGTLASLSQHRAACKDMQIFWMTVLYVSLMFAIYRIFL